MMELSSVESVQPDTSSVMPIMTHYEEVRDISTDEYFNGNKFSIDAFNLKYALNENETYVTALKRVCDYIASCESTEKLKEYWSKRWFSEIYNDWWHPAGSIMQGSANLKKISLMNCTTIALKNDTLEDIFRYTAYQVAKCAAYRQGLGVDFSNLRPRNASINNSSNESSGAVHWMGFIDSIGNKVGQRGRIPAMLFSISDTHPDLEEFITVKSDYTQIQNANISVQATDKFYESIKNDNDWVLSFDVNGYEKGDRIQLDTFIDDIRLADSNGDASKYIYAKRAKEKQNINKKRKAKELFNLIAQNMHENAEPGIQNIDIARKYSNSDYVGYPIVSTNACCVVGDTPIMTNKGLIKISDIKERVDDGEDIMAMSYDINKEIYELKPILNAWQQRNDVTVTLEIEEDNKIYNIECSADHKILTRNRGYIEAISLTEDDDIVIFT